MNLGEVGERLVREPQELWVPLEEQEPVLDEGGPLGYRELGLSKEQSSDLIQEML